MVTAILELVVIILKLFLHIMSMWLKWKMEERKRFEDRMKILTGLLKEAVENKDESMNEEAYLSNLEWEEQERYKKYKEVCLKVLSIGEGFDSLKQNKVLGMHLRLEQKKDETITILIKDISVEEKSKLISKLLLEI